MRATMLPMDNVMIENDAFFKQYICESEFVMSVKHNDKICFIPLSGEDFIYTLEKSEFEIIHHLLSNKNKNLYDSLINFLEANNYDQNELFQFTKKLIEELINEKLITLNEKSN